MNELLQMTNALDILILASIAASILVSIFRGGVREVASILALVAGFFLAAKFYGFAAEQVFRITSHDEVNNTVSFLVIFLFVAAMVSYAGGQLTELIKKSKLRGWNITLGIVLGTIRGVLIACFLVYALLVLLPYDSKTFTDSKLMPYTLSVTKIVSPLGPQRFEEDFDRKLLDYRKTIAMRKVADKDREPAPAKGPEKVKQPEKGTAPTAVDRQAEKPAGEAPKVDKKVEAQK